LLLSLPASRAQGRNDEKAGKEEMVPQAAAAAPQLQISPFYGGYFGINATFSNTTGNPGKLAKYEPLQQGTRPTFQTGIWGYSGGVGYDISGARGVDPNDRYYRLRADFLRYWTSEARYSRILNRLPNDPMDNLDVAKGSVVVRHDNTDTGIDYCPYYQDIDWKNRVTMPFLPQLSLQFDYRDQRRKGTSQARASSKCANCHTTSYVREMDQDIQEYRTGAELIFKRTSLRYQFSSRDSEDKAPPLYHVYDEAQHPATLQQVFTNRVQYDQDSGPLPIAVVPHFRKKQHLLKGEVDLERFGRFQASYLNARSENIDRAYGFDTSVASGVYSLAIGKGLNLTLRARRLDIDSDSYYVDVNEPVANAGPQLGLTFSQAYPDFGEADYTTHSSEARRSFTGGVDGRLTLPGRSVFRFGYEYENLERPYFEVEETDTQKLRLSFNSRPWKEFTARAGYTYLHADYPFTHRNAALSPVIQPYPSPGNPPSPLPGTQYFVMYEARQAHLTNYPTSSHQVSLNATWSPSDRFALTAHLRSRNDDNDKLNYGAWNDSSLAPSAEIWFAPSERIDISANYSYSRRNTETLLVMPVFDG